MANAEKLLCSISFSEEALQDTNREVWVGLNWPRQGWAGLSWVWLAVYSCSPFHGLVRALPHAWGASGAAVQLCLQLRTPALSPPPTTTPREQKIPENEAWELGDGCGQTERPREGIRRAGEQGPEQSRINSLHDRSTSLFLFHTLCCSLAERMLLLTSSCSSSCITAIKQNALFMKPFSQIHIAT